MTIKAYRGGKTASSWTDDCYNEKLFGGTKTIYFTLSMPSKGGGVTDVKLEIASESFELLAQSMFDELQNCRSGIRLAWILATYRRSHDAE